MKLRIRDNSLRLRLSRTEVGQLASSGECAATMALAAGEFRYRVITELAAARPTAAFGDGCVTVSLPAPIVAAWARSESVSIRGEDGPLSILVEKDFVCLKPRAGEDESDLFPHPQDSGS